MTFRTGLIVLSLTILMSSSMVPLPGPDLVRQLAVLVPMLVFVLLEFTKPAVWRLSEARAWTVVVFAGLLVFSVVRGLHAQSGGLTVATAIPQIATIVTVTLFGFVVFARDSGIPAGEVDLIALAFAPGLLVAANLALWFAGIGSDVSNGLAAQSAGMLAVVGIDADRTTFPLTVGWNQMGVGSAVAACAVLLITGRTDRVIKLLAGVACALSLTGILLSDSRGAMISLLIALAMTLVLAYRGAHWPDWKVAVPLVVSVFVATSFVMADTLVPVAKATLPSLLDIRDDGADSPRTVMRDSVIDALTASGAKTLVGWGEFGQVPSGAFSVYGAMFMVPGSISSGPDHFWTTHNLALQTLVDMGVIGLIALCMMFAFTLKGLAERARCRGDAGYALFAMVLALAFSGITEASPTLYQPATLWLLLLLACAGVGHGADPHRGWST